MLHESSRASSVNAVPSAHDGGDGDHVAGVLTLEHALTPTHVDLTTEGTADWVVWGLTGTQVAETRKANVRPMVLPWRVGHHEVVAAYAEGPVLMSWDDGAPVKQATDCCAGVFANGEGVSWEVRVMADTVQRTVRIYCHHWLAFAEMQVELSDGSAPQITWRADEDGSAEEAYMVTINYRASRPGEHLIVHWRKIHSEAIGNLGLHAVTVSGPPVTAPDLGVTLTEPEAEACVPWTMHGRIRLAADVRGTTGEATVRFYEGGMYLGSVTAPPYELMAAIPKKPRPSFRADVVDEHRVIAVSGAVPVNVHMTTRVIEHDGSQQGMLDGSVYTQLDDEERDQIEPWNPALLTVDFTREGTLDWIHWGCGEHAITVNRKAGVTPMISNVRLLDPFGTPVAPPGIMWVSSWSDGTPLPVAQDVGNGYVAGGTDNGFEFTVHADKTTRVLKVYASLWGGCYGRLSASLSDGSALDWVDDTFRSASGFANCVYTLKYRAALDNEQLTVRVVLHNKRRWGSIHLVGAALSEAESA